MSRLSRRARPRIANVRDPGGRERQQATCASHCQPGCRRQAALDRPGPLTAYLAAALRDGLRDALDFVNLCAAPKNT
jgi:hypothetical protein